MPERSTDAARRQQADDDPGTVVIDPSAVAALVRWYEAEARDLPWRRTSDPYRILVSEVMLQQTRVEFVIARYESFLRTFPDLESLAAASEDEVLAEWSGLGYYRRARNLHRLARQVIASGSSGLPQTLVALRALPGIGEYTAAAVASIAFGWPHLSVDGNVGRVLCRVLDIRDDPRRAAARKNMHRACEAALRSHPPGLINQALMELGARVCTPRSPRCDACPLAPVCVAAAENTQDLIPVRQTRVVRAVEEGAAVIERHNRFLLLRGQRPGALADMWEFPTLDSRLGEQIVAEAPSAADGTVSSEVAKITAIGRALQRHLRSIGVHIHGLEHVGEIRHGITNRRIRCHVYRPSKVRLAAAGSTTADAPPRQWFSPQELHGIPLGATVGKILAALGAAI